MRISITRFGGLAPKISPRLLPNTSAQTAQNCDLRGGTLKPLRGLTAVQAVPAGTLSMFPYNSSWLTWTSRVRVARGPVANDQYGRIYYNDGTKPKVRGVNPSTGIEFEYDLGVPAPTNAPTVAVAMLDPTECSFTLEWYWQYENPTTREITQENTMAAASFIQVSADHYTLMATNFPAKVTAAATDAGVIWIKVFDQYGNYLGRVFPKWKYSYYNISDDSDSDAYVSGALMTSEQINKSDRSEIYFYMDTDRVSDYEVDRTYVYTLVSAEGEEGPPSDPSDIVAVTPVEYCTLTGFDVAAPAGTHVTKIRIYRSVALESGEDTYLYCTEVNLGTASYVDKLTYADLGEIIPSMYYDPPNASITGLVKTATGALAGYMNNTVYFSVPYLPHAWPAAYGYSFPGTIVGIEDCADGVLVVTDRGAHLLVGSHPDSVRPINGTLDQPCSSAASLVAGAWGTIYACPDGLVAYAGTEGRLITEAIYTEEQWAALSPSAMVGAFFDNRCFMWNGALGIILAIEGEGALVTTTDVVATAAHTDEDQDKMYVVVGTTLYQWEADATGRLTATWRSKEFVGSRPDAPLLARVWAESYNGYPVLKMTANNAEVLSLTAASEAARKIPRLRREKCWEFELVTNKEVYELTVASAMSAL